VKVNIQEASLDLIISPPSNPTSLHVSPLFAVVDPLTSSYKVLGSKIEIQLQKANAGIQWKKLESEKSELTMQLKEDS